MAHRPFASIEEALDHAANLLAERFAEVDQQAAVALAGVLYSTQERDEFLQRQEESSEMAYRG